MSKPKLTHDQKRKKKKAGHKKAGYPRPRGMAEKGFSWLENLESSVRDIK